MSTQNTSIANLQTASIKQRLKEADKTLSDGNAEEAVKLASAVLDEDGENPIALFILCRAFHDLKRSGLAQAVGRMAVSLLPESHEAWHNLGLSYLQAYECGKAIACLERALKINLDYYPSVLSLAVAYQHDNRPMEGLMQAEKAAVLEPEDFASAETMGYCSLMLHRWTPGWGYYNIGLGSHQDRTIRCYGANDVPEWDGTKGQTVVLYAEQGIGDELCFTQYVPEMMKDCNLIVETCATHYNLFNSSFDCPVYGTRYVDNPEWVKDHKIDAKLSMAQGMQRYRATNEKFTGKPHLRASEEKRKWWRAILSQYPGQKIGISWTAGLPDTGKKHRTMDPEDFLPVFKKDATFVCLEYKNPSKDLERMKELGVNILDFSMFINGRKNYEDTAALVSELDHVIAPTTAIVDLCGGLGVSCDAFVPTKPFWRYTGENVWYKSVNWIHQKGSWKQTVESYMEETCQIV